MIRKILVGMGTIMLLTGILILILQLSRKGKMVKVQGIIQETGRDTETTHDNWAKVLVTKPDGTRALYMAQLRGQFAEEHLNQQVDCYINPQDKTGGSFLPHCYVEDGYASDQPGLARAILPAAIFLAVGVIMIFSGFRMPDM